MNYQLELAETVEEVDRMLFLSQLERNVAVGGKSYRGCSDNSLSPVEAAKVREGICSFLFGTTMELPTSKLIVELFNNELPDLNRLGLGGVADVIDGPALSVLVKERCRNSDFVVYTSDILNVSLANVDIVDDNMNLSWLTMIRADITGIRTNDSAWARCRTIDLSNCSKIYGMKFYHPYAIWLQIILQFFFGQVTYKSSNSRHQSRNYIWEIPSALVRTFYYPLL